MSDDPMAEIKASFFVECEDLLESLHDALGVMSDGADDPETINVVFRAVHSIKGGAGAFGLDTLVAFAHRCESVMDEVRSGRLEMTPGAIKLFFRAADTLQDHVRAARDENPPPDDSDDILAELEALLGDDALVADEAVNFTPVAFSMELPFDDDAPADMANIDDSSADPGFEITFKPHAGLYKCGNEAQLILRTLSELGRATIRCQVPEDLPKPAEATAECPSLSWQITLTGDLLEEELRQIFDFVLDVCDLDIRPIANPAAEVSSPSPVMHEQIEPTPAQPPFAIQAGQSDEPAAALLHPVDKSGLNAPIQIRQPVTTANSSGDTAPITEPAVTVRVDLEKIDRLVNLVGELVINQAMLAQSVETSGLGEQADVMSGLESFMSLTRDLQESVMKIRAQPVKSLFQRMGRIVREASSGVGKDVRLKTDGEYTEVDKTIIERLAEPLTHMIRNAVDHGLETPENRLIAGKGPQGEIMLTAAHRAGRVVIEIRDDGAGIDRPKVRQIATQKGLIAHDAALSDCEIDNLLFLPGFSTATEISALSGRGVGMDVVKSAITGLGGRISITSSPGKGTKFSISLPLTLAVLDGMVVQAAGQTLVIPLSAIVETAALRHANIQNLTSDNEMIMIRGTFVPLFDLASQLGFRKHRSNGHSGIVLLTVQDDGRYIALAVDAIMEQRQVVIKGFGQAYGQISGIAAATILGDGQIALIIDPADLTRTTPISDLSPFKAAG